MIYNYSSTIDENIKISPQSSTYPSHWGPLPTIQLKDRVKLPLSYGFGSSTLHKWIQSCLMLENNIKFTTQKYIKYNSDRNFLKWKVPERMNVHTVHSIFVYHYFLVLRH